MQIGKRLIDKPIFTIGQGYQVGLVKDFYLDPGLTELAGLYLGGEGLFSRKFHYVRRVQIHLFGVDVVLANSGVEAITGEAEKGEVLAWLRRDKLAGREVHDPTGKKVATVGDIIFDPQGRILGFLFAKVFVTGPLAENQSVRRQAILECGEAGAPMIIDHVAAEKQNWFFGGL